MMDDELQNLILSENTQHKIEDGKHFFTFNIEPVERNEIEVKRKHKKLSKGKKNGGNYYFSRSLESYFKKLN